MGKNSKSRIHLNILKIRGYLKNDNLIAGIINDIVFVVCAIAFFALLSQVFYGTYYPMVVVESGSMVPHMNIGDVVFIKSIDRTEIITHEEGMRIDYRTFGGYGDVIMYRPYGDINATPVMHRVMYSVRKGGIIYPENATRWDGLNVVPFNGYITKGDHNTRYDQETKICVVPVKDEWIIGIAKQKIPYLGYVRFAGEAIIPN